MNTCVIGLGLIGGSMALAIKKAYPEATIDGIDANPEHAQKAKELSLVDRLIDHHDLDAVVDLVIVATPVDVIAEMVAAVLNQVGSDTLVMDVGSTKSNICKALEHHPKRDQFLATHQMAGTEFSGPTAAVQDLFQGRRNIICERKRTRVDLFEKGSALFTSIGMRTVCMDPLDHDHHIAYISHLSHVSSFMLGETVLKEEAQSTDEENRILDMAGSGFASTVRLAKSDPQTWTSIFLENKKNVIQALGEYIDNLETFKKKLEDGDKNGIFEALLKVNKIKRYLK